MTRLTNRGARRRLPTALGGVVLTVAALGLTACGGGGSSSGNPLQQTGGAKGTVVVGSANFPESTLLGEIYAQVLAAKGVKVTRKFNIGSREVYYNQVVSGGITVMPEYNGALLTTSVDQKSTAVTTDQVNAELNAKLPKSVKILDSARAEDKDSVTVTEQTAAKYHLKSIADLAPVAKNLAIGGPPEFKTRQQGLVGLQSKYGLTFKEFKPLDTAGPVTVAKLKSGDVDAADLFTTDPAIITNKFVVLEDPKNVFSAQNVTPLVYTAGVNDTIVSALNAVSAKLTTQDLLDMNKRIGIDKADASTVAKDWVTKNGLA